MIIFNLGHLIQVVASSWVILELTGSPLWVSLMVAAPTLPLLILSLPAGAAADLFDRRSLLVVASAILAVASMAMSALWAIGEISPGRLVGLGLVIGIGVALFNPAWQATVPSLVPSSLIPGAVSLNSASAGLATAVGPALGGLLVATLGPGWSFGASTVGYLAVLVAALTSGSVEWSSDRSSMPAAIATGLRYLRFSQGYLWLMLLGCLFGFTSAALRSMLPNLTSDVLGGDSTLYGILLGTFGAGALVGGLTRSLAGTLFGSRMIAACILAFGAAGVIAGLAREVWLMGAAVGLAGLLWTWILATLTSTYQLLTPDWVRGRTMSAFTLSVFGFYPLGAVAAGALGSTIGAGGSLVVFSAGIVALGFASFRMPIPVLERIESPVVEDQPRSAEGPESRREPVMVVNRWTIHPDGFDSLVDVLDDLRRLRLSTGAFQWDAYRSAGDPHQVSEVVQFHSWDQYLEHHRRTDLAGRDVIARMHRHGDPESPIVDHLIHLDVDLPKKRPSWGELIAEHEHVHRPRLDNNGA